VRGSSQIVTTNNQLLTGWMPFLSPIWPEISQWKPKAKQTVCRSLVRPANKLVLFTMWADAEHNHAGLEEMTDSRCVSVDALNLLHKICQQCCVFRLVQDPRCMAWQPGLRPCLSVVVHVFKKIVPQWTWIVQLGHIYAQNWSLSCLSDS